MGLPTLVCPCQWEVTKTTKLIEQKHILGDGYIQYMSVGINPLLTEWNVKTPVLTRTKINLLVSQLETFAGSISFLWSPDNGVSEPLTGYYCDEWVVTPLAPNAFTLEAVFLLDGSSECISLAANTNTELMKVQLEGLINFFNTYSRSIKPMVANAQGVTVEAFQSVEGRGGYLPTSTGTSESQTLLIAGILAARRSITSISIKTIALNLATNYSNALIQYFYQGDVPANPNAQIWLPHGLVNSRQTFISKGKIANNTINSGHFNYQVSFTNGVGTIPTSTFNVGDKLSDVYKVYSTNGKILWESVRAQLGFGTEYKVNYWVSNPQLLGNNFRYYPDSSAIGGTIPNPTTEIAGKIVLDSTFTGNAIVLFSALVGQVVDVNEPFEDYPMWIKNTTNISIPSIFKSHIMSVSNLAYNAFDELLIATSNAKWQRAKDATLYSTTLVSQIINESYLFKVDTTTVNPYSYPGTVGFIYRNSSNGTITRINTGWVQITVNDGPELFPLAELKNTAMILQIEPNSSIEISIGCSVTSIMEVYMSLSSVDENETRLFIYYLPVIGGTDIAISILPTEFVKYNLNNWWYSRINQDNSIVGSPIYINKDVTSTVSSTLELSTIDGNKRLITTLNMNKINGGFTRVGFNMLNVGNEPPAIYYSKTGSSVKIKIVDSLNQIYLWTLPDTGIGWSTFNPRWSTADINSNLLPGDGLIQSVEVMGDIDGTSVTKIWWIGAGPELLPSSCLTYKCGVFSSVDTAHIFKIGNFRVINSPLSLLKGSPGVIPSTVSVKIDGNGIYNVDTFRVLQAVSGSQNPSMWSNWNYPDRAQQSLTFLKESQQSYGIQNINNTLGPFSPVFIWPSWDVGVNGTPNKWSFKDMLDPSRHCSAYQFRPLVNVAEYWKSNPKDLSAESIVMTFLRYIDEYFRKNANSLLPTHFYEFVDPVTKYISIQDYALVARTALYANMTGGSPSVTYRVFKKVVDFLMSEYVSTGPMAGTFTKSQISFVEEGVNIKELYVSQHAEIMITLSEIIKYKIQMKYPACSVSLV